MKLEINGTATEVDAPPDMPLLWVLRDFLRLTGTKYGCGIAVNPAGVVAQMESGIAFGLGAALYGRIDLREGRPQQSNFHDYRVLRLDEMPQVEVHIVPSTERPGGVGEPGVPPIAPAVANAVFALTGRRLRELPLA